MAGLLDLIQSASNAVAGNVSGPVDMLAWGLRKAGLPIPSDPVGGAEWMRRHGLMRDVAPSASSVAGETLGLLAPFGAVSGAGKVSSAVRGLLDEMPTGRNASRSTSIYDPKPKPQRSFAEDYPSSTAATGSKLAHDIDGNPISPSAVVVGRRVAGGDDVGLTAPEVQKILDAMEITVTPVKRGGPKLKASEFGRWDSPFNAIYVDEKLTDPVAQRVLNHELGHAIDGRANAFGGSLQGVLDDAKRVYSETNSSGWVSNWRKGHDPGSFGYKNPSDIRGEYMAEAIRAYMTDPNYIKTIAPELAARIRQLVNSSKVNEYVHFNSLAPGVAVGGLLDADFGSVDGR